MPSQPASTGPERPALPAGTRQRHGPLRAAGLALLGLCSFLATAGFLRGWMPHAEQLELGPKLDVLAEDPAAYDLAYIGSSTVFRHFVPEVFDARMAEHGYPLRSFNLGNPALGGFELDHALRRLSDLPGLDLDFVLVEPSTPRLPMVGGPVPTERQVDHHDAVTMLRVVERFLQERELPWSARREAMVRHLRCFAWRSSNYGQWRRIAMGLRGEDPLPGARAWIEEGAGYRALEDDPAEAVVRRGESFRQDPSALARARETLTRSWVRADAAGEPNWAWVDRQMRLLRGVGARPALVISARTSLAAEHLRLPEGLDDVPLFAYNDPRDLPRLYEPEARFDKNHLTAESAAWLTRRLADDLVAELGDELDAWKAARDGESGP